MIPIFKKKTVFDSAEAVRLPPHTAIALVVTFSLKIFVYVLKLVGGKIAIHFRWVFTQRHSVCMEFLSFMSRKSMV